MAKGQIIINDGQCLGCGYCVYFCSRGCITITGDKISPFGYSQPTFVQFDNCTACGVCSWMCPHFAIEVQQVKESKTEV